MGLEPGDRIAYRGRDIFQVGEEGTVKALWAGVEGTVKSGHRCGLDDGSTTAAPAFASWARG